MTLRIAFAGTPEFAVPALDALARSGHPLVGVLTQPDRPAGRGRVLTTGAVKRRALELNLPVDQPERLATEAQRATLASWQPELLVVVAYGLILPPAVLTLPRLGCLNIHASLLPRWRGAAPIQRAIEAGDAQTGVCIMQLEAGLDTGPVYSERRVPITRASTAATLQPQLAQLGAEALLPVIDALVAGRVQPRPQPAEGVTYARKISKDEARIDWRRAALQIERQVHAFDPWPVAEALLGGERVRIWEVEAMEEPGMPDGTGLPEDAPPGTARVVRGERLEVACGRGRLAILRLQLPGRRAMNAAEFLHGHGPGALVFA